MRSFRFRVRVYIPAEHTHIRRCTSSYRDVRASERDKRFIVILSLPKSNIPWRRVGACGYVDFFFFFTKMEK